MTVHWTRTVFDGPFLLEEAFEAIDALGDINDVQTLIDACNIVSLTVPQTVSSLMDSLSQSLPEILPEILLEGLTESPPDSLAGSLQDGWMQGSCRRRHTALVLTIKN